MANTAVTPSLRISGPALSGWVSTTRRWMERHNALVALVVYSAIAIYWDRSTVASLGSACTCGLPGDPAEFAWSFDWFPHALLHGLNPLYSKAMWTPTGINLAGTNAMPVLSLLVAPVTWLWGPIVSYNLLTLAAPITGAWAAFLLCRHVTRAPWVSMLVGTAYGFSTFETAELGGHLPLAVICFPPLIALCVLRAIDGIASRRSTIVQLTLLLIGQFYTSIEISFTMTAVGAVLLVSYWIFGSREVRARIVTVVPSIVIAYVILLLLSSWYILEFLKAPAYAKDLGFNSYPTDLLSFVIPNPPTWLGGPQFDSVTAVYVGGTGETLSYVGLPMIMVALRYLFTRWSSAATRALTVTLVVMIFWILDGHLYVAGRPTIWLPYSLIGKLPFFNDLMQGRVALELSLWCAVVLAMWLASPSVGWMRGLRWGVAVLAVACVIPNLVQHATFYWTNPTFFKTTTYQRYLKKGETILPIAWGGFSEAPMWQAEDHMYWNEANGYFLFPPPVGWRGPLTNDLWYDTPQAGDGRRLHHLLIERHVSDVVVQASEIQRWAPTLLQAELKPTVTVGGVTIYHVPSAWGRAAA